MSQLIVQPGIGGPNNSINNGNPSSNGATNTVDLIGTKVAKTHTYYRELLRFDVSAIRSNCVVKAATLTLATDGFGIHAGTGYTFNVYRVTQPWTANGATWNSYDGSTSWTTPGGDYDLSLSDSCTPADAASNLVFANMASLVADAAANRSGLLSLIVIGPESSSGGANVADMITCRNDDQANRPKLVIDLTIPPMAAMAGGMHEPVGNLRG
jgi:hypothetical protein